MRVVYNIYYIVWEAVTRERHLYSARLMAHTIQGKYYLEVPEHTSLRWLDRSGEWINLSLESWTEGLSIDLKNALED